MASLFRTLKYWPAWPHKGFASMDEARQWVRRFVDWYSHMHRHSGIQFVTPSQRHHGQDKALLAKRQAARLARPERAAKQDPELELAKRSTTESGPGH